MSKIKQRHWFLTAVLLLGLLISAYSTYVNFFPDDKTSSVQALLGIPDWQITARGILGAIDVYLFIALFRWRQSAFTWFAVTTCISVMLNVYSGLPLVASSLGLLRVALLYFALSLGRERSGWNQLE